MIWGFAFVAQLIGKDHVSPFTFNGTRFLLGAISLIPVFLIFEKTEKNKQKAKTTLIAGAIAGMVLFTASALQQFGINITSSAGRSGFITGLYMVLVPIINMMFFGKKTTVNNWIGALVALIGLYLLSFPNGITSIGVGDLVLLVGAVFWAFHIITIDSFGSKIYSLRFSFTQFLVCALLNIICMLIFEDFSFSSIMAAKYPILYAGLMSTGVAYTLQVLGQKNADPTAATIIMSTESVFSAVGEMLFFTFIMRGYDYSPMTLKGYIGCAIMFVGILLTQFTFGKKALVNEK